MTQRYGCRADIPAAQHRVECHTAAPFGQVVVQTRLVRTVRRDLDHRLRAHEIQHCFDQSAGQAQRGRQFREGKCPFVEQVFCNQVNDELSRQAGVIEALRPRRKAREPHDADLVGDVLVLICVESIIHFTKP
jgi:hypothetical protein